jgi:hypothetical protein
MLYPLLHVVFDRKEIVKRKYNYLKDEHPENSMQMKCNEIKQILHA